MAYTTHLNPLVKAVRRTPNAAVLDLTLRVYKDGHGGIAAGKSNLQVGDQAQLCADLSNLVGLMLRQARKTR